MKQWLALASIFCVFMIQKSYQTGEVELKYWDGMKYLAYCWACWALVAALIF
ncbi:MAG: hypothetical protein IPN29_06765 [Saprospiraceae bacterium]|nr:hypothetical protein [Saprospiraceae bacterium]